MGWVLVRRVLGGWVACFGCCIWIFICVVGLLVCGDGLVVLGIWGCVV